MGHLEKDFWSKKEMWWRRSSLAIIETSAVES